ncbi:GDYXXLXY domain-containing protein [Fictibacillus phosphorivorans]|uniref:GDYXXLXY domain-containing protein n=1 Tax=Fictibacillus phosphorivorans TaxID=1221500 RepID=UPI00203D8F27|nr:GDYXXLXY domain-containing protein [Fictibacillus phosphorivorans]MCM3717528.1 GDYXXLXY domain-containing protein [Fictibacillus phosphorivorans]MCM3775223.1 GDYXXLXY domain-containing protein [Fictibacillus phosphorivorans]
MNRKKGWIIAASLQVLFLLFIAGSYYSIDYVGKEIKIKTVPVDPRDILYGDYVTLSFDISTVPVSKWKGDRESLNSGQQTVFVVLEENKEGYYDVISVHPDKPDVDDQQVTLKGKAERFWGNTTDQIQIHYGLERYYVEENTGKALEQQASDMAVTIKIAPWGAQKITDLKPL